jgi:GAF domain-containing protein
MSEQTIRNLQAVLRLSTTINSSLELEQILNAACQAAVELMEVDHSGLVLFDANLERGEVRAEYPPDLGAKGLKIQVYGVPAEERLLVSNEPVQFEDIENEPSLGPVREVLLGLGIRSILIVPVISKGRLLGSFSLDSLDGTRRFTEEEIEICKVFASQVAVAIDNASLFNETVKQKANLEQLLEASNLIAKAEDLDAGLQNLAEMVVSLLSSTFCRILLVDEGEENLLVKAAYPIERKNKELIWNPGRFSKTEIDEWAPLKELLQAGKPVVLRGNDPRVQANLARFSTQLRLAKQTETSIEAIDIQSLLLVPLKIRNRLIGLLDVGEVRNEKRSYFTKEKIELTAAIGAQAAVLIDCLWQHQVSERRRWLLTALEQSLGHIRAARETAKLYNEIAHLAVEKFGFDSAYIYVHHPYLGKLERRDSHGNLSDVGSYFLQQSDRFAENVSRNGNAEVQTLPDEIAPEGSTVTPPVSQVMIGIPIMHIGSVEAVLVVFDDLRRLEHIEVELEVLKRFAALSAIELQTARLITREQRIFGQLMTLQKIGDYTLRAQADVALDKILHIVLTGVTAGYGLGFNRAILFLRDEKGGDLIGHLGIGQIHQEELPTAWSSPTSLGLDDFKQYIDHLEKDEVPETSLGKVAKSMQFRVKTNVMDTFSQAVLKHQPVLVTVERFDELPEAFKELCAPTTPVAVVPLVAHDHVIGLLVVDNKFTQSPIDLDDIEVLLTFTHTAAIAMDNVRLFQDSQNARQQMQLLYEASNTLISSKEPPDILKDIVAETRKAAGADWVRVILVDELGRAKTLMTDGETDEVSLEEVLRPNGLALEVVKTGKHIVIEDKHTYPHSINQILMRDKMVSALCLPVSLQGHHIGVMWISYIEPRRFPEFEVNALQLYVNQAAIAYDNARRIEELEHMREAADALAGAANVEEVLYRINEGAMKVLEAQSAAIWSYDEVRHMFIYENSIAVGISAENWLEFWKADPKLGGTAYTVMEKEYAAVCDVSDVEQFPFLGETTRGLLEKIEVKSFQGIALTAGKEKLGVLYVNYDRTRQFSREEEQTARTFANHAALALQKTKLFEQVTKARNAARVAAETTALENLQGSLKSIVEGAGDVLRSDAVTLYTYDWDRQEFGFPPAMDGVWDEERVLKLGQVAGKSVVRNILELDTRHVAQKVMDDPVLRGPFVRREQIESTVAVPLKARDRKVGVMFVNYRTPHRFTQDELTNIDLFAYQAAVAIRNAQVYNQSQKRVAALKSLYEAGNAITETLNLKEILKQIAEQGWRLASNQGEKRSFVDIKLVNAKNATLEAVYPEEEWAKIGKEFGEDIDLEKGIKGQIGIVGRAVLKKQTQLVNDVHNDPDYYCLRQETRSQLVVLIKKDKEVIGVISVEHPEFNAFDEEDRQTFNLLAAQASSAIQNANAYEDLKLTKGRLAAASTLAWAGMDSSIWRHEIQGHAINIRNVLTMIRKIVGEWDLNSERMALLEKRLEFIQQHAQRIMDKELIPSLSAEAGVEPIFIEDLIRERIGQLQESGEVKSINFALHLSGENLKVRISPDWFRRALDILTDNAIEAMRYSPVRSLTISTEVVKQSVHIEISDTGKGIPHEEVEKIFKEPIDKSGKKVGLGIGLLMVQAIVETYNGSIRLEKTEPNGTVFSIFFPLE